MRNCLEVPRAPPKPLREPECSFDTRTGKFFIYVSLCVNTLFLVLLGGEGGRQRQQRQLHRQLQSTPTKGCKREAPPPHLRRQEAEARGRGKEAERQPEQEQRQRQREKTEAEAKANLQDQQKSFNTNFTGRRDPCISSSADTHVPRGLGPARLCVSFSAATPTDRPLYATTTGVPYVGYGA